MSEALAFLFWLLLVVLSSFVLSRQVERLGAELRFTASLQGIVTALAADAPEISTGISAMASGHADLGLGVVIGSNIFNLAALLGLSVMIAGEIRISGSSFWLNAAVAIAVTALGAATVWRWISPTAASIALAFVFVPYIALVAIRQEHLDRAPLPRAVVRFLKPVVQGSGEAGVSESNFRRMNLTDYLSLVPSLVTVVIGSVYLVRLGHPLALHIGIPPRFIGPVILAGLTGIPNAISAVQLARRGRGTSVMSEALNSNSINVAIGICISGVFLGVHAASGATTEALWWLCGATAATLVLVGVRKRLGRVGACVPILFYLGFLARLTFAR
ncbi:MAG: hypothetical protein ABIQ16_11210 [Polyangiaceae bacterium]